MEGSRGHYLINMPPRQGGLDAKKCEYKELKKQFVCLKPPAWCGGMCITMIQAGKQAGLRLSRHTYS